ncbi:hypothetical protein FRC03_004536 [Tulasnella sp. 419]|nr:hypothetical protein FRC02_007795 [Tulasnella sp. 418]KAG8962171.1 hypothetical protein FRC03_004536 [Tulasnella sp. 419]
MHPPSLSDCRSPSHIRRKDDVGFSYIKSSRRVSLGALEVAFKTVSLHSPSPTKRRQSLNLDFFYFSSTKPLPSTPERTAPFHNVPPAPARMRHNVPRLRKQDLKLKDLQSRLSFIARRYNTRRSHSQTNQNQNSRRRTSFVANLLPSLPIAGDTRAEGSMFGATPLSYVSPSLSRKPIDWEATSDEPIFELF